MLLNLNQIGQISLPSSDIERTEAFYGGVLGLRKLYRFGDLTFFDCAGVRLLFEKVKDPAELVPRGCLYFRCADARGAERLQAGGVNGCANCANRPLKKLIGPSHGRTGCGACRRFRLARVRHLIGFDPSYS